ncbi:MAG: ABC transporter permease [Gammaproteobacteria bacterium]
MQRLASGFATVMAISACVFLLAHVVPGDPVDAMLGERATAADRAELRRALGLDAPLGAQFGAYYARLARGDLGRSLHSQRAIGGMIAERAPYTLGLAAAALVLAVAIALPLGLWSALSPTGWPERIGATVALIGGAVPGFVIGPVLIVVFAVGLGWFPIGGADSPRSVFLPALTLASGLAAVLSRQLRAALIQVLGEPYFRAAAARGLPFAVRVRRHALRNAAIPVLTVFGMQLGALLGGAVITETVFAWPGLGTLAMEAIERRDYPVLQACVLVVSACYVGVNMLTDWVCAWCDPRIGDAW